MQEHLKPYLNIPLRWVLVIPLALQIGLGGYSFVLWSRTEDTLSQPFTPMFSILGLILAIGVGGWLLIYRCMNRALKLLTQRIHQIEQGHFSSESLPTHFLELDHLAEAIMAMSLRMQNSFREQEAKLNLVLAAEEMGTWQRDLYTDSERQQWSPEIYRQLGLDPEQVPQPTRQTFLDRVHPEDLHLFGKIDWLQEQGSHLFQQEFRIIRPNGEIRWIRSFGQALKNHQGKRTQVFGINKDITQEKQREADQQATLQALKISKARLKALIDNLPFRVWARDPEGRIIIQNSVDIADFGDLLGTTVEDLNLDVKTYQEWQKFLARLQSGETIYHRYSETINGEDRQFLAIAAPVEESTAGLGMIGISIDITEQTKTEAALKVSEAKFRALVENLPFRVWARDGEDILIYQSKSDQKQYGNCLGQRIEDMNLSEEEILDWQDTVAKIKTGEAIKREKKVCCDEGEKHFLFIGVPIRQEDQIIGSLGVHVDITEQRRAEANLVQARSQLEMTLKGGNMGVWEADLITSKMWWSPEQYHILGFVSDEHGHVLDPQGQVVAPYPTRELIFNRILPSAQKECQDNIEKALSTGRYPDSEYPYIRPDGELRWLLFRAKLDSDDSGQVKRLLGVCIDITDRKRMELQLELLASIVRSSIDAIISTDLKGVILTWNEGAERTYGYLAEEVMGINIRDILPEILEHGLSPEVPFISQHRTKEGRLIDVFVTISILKGVRGDPCGTSWIIRDISYQKEVARLKDEFISVVSHELRTPITSIHGSLTTLNTGIFGSLQPMGQELLHIAEQNTTRLIRLVNDILDLERLDDPNLPLDRQPCRCAELVAQACATMQALAEQAQIQIQQTLTDCTFWADPDLIVQVLTNLLSNAIKFSPPHSSIHISAQAEQDTLLIAVRDHGLGIPADKLELIFERFQQVDASDSRKKGGTGLGLAICRQIVQQHQGRIWAESRLGEGSIFYVALPLRDPRQ